MENTPISIDANNNDPRDPFFKLPANASQLPSRPNRENQVINSSVKLLQNFLSSMIIMSQRVKRPEVLSSKYNLWVLSSHGFTNAQMTFTCVKPGLARGAYDLCAHGLQYIRLLLAHSFRHRADQLVPFDSCSHGESDSCVARSRLSQGHPWLQFPRTLQVSDNARADPVFY